MSDRAEKAKWFQKISRRRKNKIQEVMPSPIHRASPQRAIRPAGLRLVSERLTDVSALQRASQMALAKKGR